ncbi:SemiSWEET transporter (plasmid) [Bacillus sp. F19]|nr:SemiSWEET transporter [Bacillus sp. F19]
MSVALLGVIAGILTSCSFIPQAYKVIKSKRTKDISIPMYSLCTLGVFFWIIYGLMIKDLAVLLTNIVTFVPTVIILILTVKYQIKSQNSPN